MLLLKSRMFNCDAHFNLANDQMTYQMINLRLYYCRIYFGHLTFFTINFSINLDQVNVHFLIFIMLAPNGVGSQFASALVTLFSKWLNQIAHGQLDFC